MGYRMVAAVMLLWGPAMANAQQVLLVKPGGIVSFNGDAIATHDKVLSADELTFQYGGLLYANGGPAYFEMMASNSVKYGVADRIDVKDGQLRFDGKPIVLGVRVDRVDKALRWGEYVAAIVLTPHRARNLLEPSGAFSLIIFSPKTGKGSYRELYVAAGKAACDIWLLEPIGKAP